MRNKVAKESFCIPLANKKISKHVRYENVPSLQNTSLTQLYTVYVGVFGRGAEIKHVSVDVIFEKLMEYCMCLFQLWR